MVASSAIHICIFLNVGGRGSSFFSERWKEFHSLARKHSLMSLVQLITSYYDFSTQIMFYAQFFTRQIFVHLYSIFV